MVRFIASLIAAALMLGAPGPARARTQETFSYPASRVWTSVVRLVRVDYASPITEKDKDAGYLLFNYPYQGKSYAGSAEIIQVGDERPQVRVVISIGGMPSYVERMMLDKLTRKLRVELGAPMEFKKPKKRPEDKPDRDPKGPADREGDGQQPPADQQPPKRAR